MFPDQQDKQCQEPYSNMNAQCAQAMPARAYTLHEEAVKGEQYHYQEAAKAGDAARFLSANPAFDEFIRLVRAGAIRF